MSELSDELDRIETITRDLQSAIDAFKLVARVAAEEREEPLDPAVPDDADIEELPDPEGKPKSRRRATPKKDPPDPTSDDCIKALMEIVDTFEDGSDICSELIAEVQPGTDIVSKVSPGNRQALIDAVAKYLADCPKDDE